MVPHTQPVPASSHPSVIPPARLASRLHQLPVGCRVAILGLPDDTGVRLNHGRPGAAQGPKAFREALAGYGVAEPAGITFPRIYDAGDLVPAEGHSEAALHETHRRVTEAAKALVEIGLFPIAIGGGHDLTFPFVRGVLAGGSGSAGMLYFDAHLDVRDTVGSGMPFRRLIEDCGVGPLACVGFNPLANTAEHVGYFESHGGHAVPLDPLEGNAAESAYLTAARSLADADRLAVSFDLDAIDAAHAPGVSAINPAGLTVREAAGMVRRACADPRTICFDLMELCPSHDVQGRTARVAAHLFLHALMGLAERTPESALGSAAAGSARPTKGSGEKGGQRGGGAMPKLGPGDSR